MVTEQQLEARLAELVAQLRALFAGELDELLDDGEPRHGERVDRDTLRRYWPAGLPLPLTVGAALDAVEQGRKLIAEAVAGDIRAAAAVLVDPVAREAVLARPELAARWTWRSPPPDATDVGPSHGAELALDLLRRRVLLSNAPLGVADFARYGWSTPDLAPAVVIKWAGPRLDEAWRDRESEAAAWMRRRNARTALAWGEVVGPMVGDESAPDELLFYQSGKAEPGELLPSPSARLQADLALVGDFRRPLTVPRPDGLGCELSPGSVALLCWLESKALVALPETLDDAAWLAVQRWATKAPGDAHNAAAAAVLADNGDKDALRLLAAELCDRCNSLADATGALPPTPEDGGPRTSDGMLEIEAKLASWLERIDADGAENLRAVSRKRLAEHQSGKLDAQGLFKYWHNEGAEALERLARVLWRVEVEARWQRSRGHRPALVRAVAADTLIPLMARQFALPGLDDGIIRDDKGREVGRIATVDAATFELVRAGLHQLGKVTGHRLVRLLVHRAHDQWSEGVADPRAITFEGGWSGLAEALQVKTRDFQQLRQLLEAGQHAKWSHKEWTFNGLWTFSDKRGSRAGPGFVSIVAGEALVPNMAAMMAERGGNTLGARIARRLVPELQHEPPVSAVHEHHQGAAWTLHRAALVELVDHSDELHNEGSIHISEQRWRELAALVKFPADKLPRLLESWREGESEQAPQLLAEPERGHFTLADPHRLEREFIADLGRRRIEGKDNATKAKAHKARQRKLPD